MKETEKKTRKKTFHSLFCWPPSFTAPTDLNDLMFQILVTGIIQDPSGHVYHRSINDIFLIELPNIFNQNKKKNQKHHFLELLPSRVLPLFVFAVFSLLFSSPFFALSFFMFQYLFSRGLNFSFFLSAFSFLLILNRLLQVIEVSSDTFSFDNFVLQTTDIGDLTFQMRYNDELTFVCKYIEGR